MSPAINAVDIVSLQTLALPHREHATALLQTILDLVRPLMRTESLHVGALHEFSPANQCLLGINYNHGETIRVRLRTPTPSRRRPPKGSPHSRRTQTTFEKSAEKNKVPDGLSGSTFLPLPALVSTMVHELVHNRVGPHNAEFRRLYHSWCSFVEGHWERNPFHSSAYPSLGLGPANEQSGPGGLANKTITSHPFAGTGRRLGSLFETHQMEASCGCGESTVKERRTSKAAHEGNVRKRGTNGWHGRGETGGVTV